ncbi:MAG TPA: aldo/keto reductase [Candidatus Binatia bacterium]|nr:aldo/keto reductase [Candidatus Binatia bacterium]
MEERQLGRTGLIVSRLGLGLAALGRPGYINLGHAEDLARDYAVAAMAARTHAVLDAAWAAGVRYFDAARSYGRAEEFLAAWLTARGIAPVSVTIGSKWGYTYTADWRVDAVHHEVKEHSLMRLNRQIAESWALLGAQLDLYQIHSATIESGVLDDRAILEELARLRSDGLKIGLSVSGPQQSETLRRAMRIEIDHERVFDAVQATWNVLDPSAGPTLQAAHDAGIGVIIKEPLANGRLTARNLDPHFADRRRVLAGIADHNGLTVDAVALAAVLAQPWADVVLSGAATAAQLNSNLAALTLELDSTTLGRLLALGQRPDEYWRTRSRLPWN